MKRKPVAFLLIMVLICIIGEEIRAQDLFVDDFADGESIGWSVTSGRGMVEMTKGHEGPGLVGRMYSKVSDGGYDHAYLIKRFSADVNLNEYKAISFWYKLQSTGDMPPSELMVRIVDQNNKFIGWVPLKATDIEEGIWKKKVVFIDHKDPYYIAPDLDKEHATRFFFRVTGQEGVGISVDLYVDDLIFHREIPK